MSVSISFVNRVTFHLKFDQIQPDKIKKIEVGAIFQDEQEHYTNNFFLSRVY